MSIIEPTTSSYALFSMPLDETACAFAASFATADLYPARTDFEGKVDDLFSNLEPLSMNGSMDGFERVVYVGRRDPRRRIDEFRVETSARERMLSLAEPRIAR